MSSKYKIVSIVKNESFSIPSFVFHHLYFGFDSIDFFVNRTTDNSVDIIKKIHNKYNSINYTYCDWIDKISPNVSNCMQPLAYSYAFDYFKKSYEYIMFLDVDEFFTPINFESNIEECLSYLKFPDIIYFQWLNCDFKEAYNILPVFSQNTINTNLVLHGKSIYKNNIKIKKVKTHLCEAEDAIVLLCDGSKFNPGDHEQCLLSSLSNIRPYMIFHDLLGSKPLFLSKLLNGDLTSLYTRNIDGFFIKTNRHFPSSFNFTYSLSSIKRELYINDYIKFIDECDLEEPLNESFRFNNDRIMACIKMLNNINNDNYINDIKNIINIDTIQSVIPLTIAVHKHQ